MLLKYVNPNLSIPEILNVLEKSTGTISEKANMLKSCWNRKDVKFYIDFMYNGDSTRSKLLTALPTYKPSQKPFGANFRTIGSSLTSLESCINMLHSDNFNQNKFDNTMRSVLESISADEAELVVKLFSGKKHRGGIKSIFKEAYPEFFRTDLE